MAARRQRFQLTPNDVRGAYTPCSKLIGLALCSFLLRQLLLREPLFGLHRLLASAFGVDLGLARLCLLLG